MTRPGRMTRYIGAATAVGVMASVLAVSASAAPPAGVPDPAQAEASAGSDTVRHSVTLLTGDRVSVTEQPDGVQTIGVEPADAGTGIQSYSWQDNTYVLPDHVLPLVSSGELDLELFNVTGLIQQGYTDAEGGIPLIVGYDEQAGPTSLTGDRIGAELPSISAVAVEAAPEDAPVLWGELVDTATGAELAPGVTSVHLDARVQVNTINSVPQIGAPTAWDAGFDGEGVTIAVLDTGVDLDHPDLVDAIVDSRSFVPGEPVDDLDGHGTHVAGTAAGRGVASDGDYTGVAPGADLIIGKVLDDSGFGQLSWIIEGMEWAAQDADIVNMSLGTTVPSDGTDPLSQALNALTEDTGTLFVVAAGNQGRIGGINAPGSADHALTVGAVDSLDQRTWFTDMGPREGDAAVKPELSAPGEGIVAARSQHMAWGEGWYRSESGTSMASPHVAGAAALLLHQRPELTWQELKDVLASTSAEIVDEGPYAVGTGRVDVGAAVQSNLFATGSVSFGFYDWPHEDDAPEARTITYTNVGTESLTIDLAVQVVGGTAPDGALTLSADELVVPAGGQAEVVLELDPSLVPVGATLQGHVLASTADDLEQVRTGWGVVKEDERYELTVRAIDRAGELTATYAVLARYGADYPEMIEVPGERTLRLPAGDYSVMAFVEVIEGDRLAVALLGEPQVTLDQHTELALDAREATEITAEVPEEGLAPVYRRMEYNVGGAGLNSLYDVAPEIEVMLAAPTEAVTTGDFEYFTRWRLRAPFIDVLDQGVSLEAAGMGQVIPEGTVDLPAVYAGTGTPAEIAAVDADGAAVVVLRDPDADLGQIVSDVEDAGGAALFVINHEPWQFTTWFWPPDGEPVQIPVAALPGRVGTDLIPRLHAGGVELTLTGGVTTDVVYDLVDPHLGAIGTDLTYAPSPDELARIDSRYFGTETLPAGEFRYDFRPHSQRGWGFAMVHEVPSERTEWVSAQPGTQWYQNLNLERDWWEERGVREGYEPGSAQQVDWFAPVVHPRLGEGYWLPNRQGDFLQVNLPSWAGSQPGHTGGAEVLSQVIRWYDGDTLLKEESGWQSSWLDLGSPERIHLRVTNDVTRDPELWSTSPSSSTEWTFWTEGDPSGGWIFAELPFLQLGFDVDTDLAGVASAGPATIGLSAYHLEGVTGAADVVDAGLEISYDDGATWEVLPLTGSAGSWTAEVTYPADAEHATLRAWAVDEAGNGIEQRIERAFLIGDAPTYVERVAGLDRYQTAAEVARRFPGPVEHVYIATGQQFADALTGASPAAAGVTPGVQGATDSSQEPASVHGSPVLLVRSDHIPAATRQVLAELGPDRVTVIGSEAAVSQKVFNELADLYEVTRVEGENRYETAAALAQLYDPATVDTVYIASGAEGAFADALSGAALAGSREVPVLLTKPDHAPAVVVETLAHLDPENIVIIGGTAAVSDQVAAQVGATDRIGGQDRWETSALVAAQFPGAGEGSVFVASGHNWPDALAGSALAGLQGDPVLLTHPTRLPHVTAGSILDRSPWSVVILGGEPAVSAAVAEAVADLFE